MVKKVETRNLCALVRVMRGHFCVGTISQTTCLYRFSVVLCPIIHPVILLLIAIILPILILLLPIVL